MVCKIEFIIFQLLLISNLPKLVKFSSTPENSYRGNSCPLANRQRHNIRRGSFEKDGSFPSAYNQKCAHHHLTGVTYLRGAHDPPLILAPVHAQNLVPVAFEGPSGLHDKLPQGLHALGHLVHCKDKTHSIP